MILWAYDLMAHRAPTPTFLCLLYESLAHAVNSWFLPISAEVFL